MKPTLDIVVVTYRSVRTAESCLLSLIDAVAAHPLDVTFTIVDNSPGSEDAAWFMPHLAALRNMRVITCPDNPGFAGGCNIGLSETSSEWVVLLNPDLTLDGGVISILTSAVGDADESVAAFAIGQNTKGFVHQGISINKWGWFVDRPSRSSARLIGPSGGAAIYRRSVLEALGGFRESLFAWGEDADLAIRLFVRGFSTEPIDCTVEHLGGHSVTGPELEWRKRTLLVRNRFTVAAEHYSRMLRLRFAALSALILILETPRYIGARKFGVMLHVNVVGFRKILTGGTPTHPLSAASLRR